MFNTNKSTFVNLFDPALNTEFKRLFEESNEIFKEMPMLSSMSKYPPTNVITNGEDVVVVMAVAGYSKNDLNVSMDADTLTITGTKPADSEPNVTYIHKGISSKNFTASYKVTNREVAAVSLNDGLLRITLRSIPPKSTKVEFEIK